MKGGGSFFVNRIDLNLMAPIENKNAYNAIVSLSGAVMNALLAQCELVRV